MGLFRKKETYNQQMLREAGLDRVRFGEPTVLEPLGIPLGRPLGGPPELDALVTLTASGFDGDRIVFVALPDGDLLVEEAEGDRDLSTFADAVEREVVPPYRATAIRQEGDVWAVGVKRLDVERIAFADGDRLELTREKGLRQLRVDGGLQDGMIPELEQLGERVGADFYVTATRLDGDLWEVRVTAL